MYLVIGGNGYFGTYIIKSILENTDQQVIATSRDISQYRKMTRLSWERCDITNDDDVVHLLDKTDVRNLNVVFLAAYHHPDLVAQNPELAWSINVTALLNCISKMKGVHRLFYASTDSVYGNSINGYHFRENDDLNPVNIYGQQKVEAEKVVMDAGFHVARFPFLIAPSLVSGKPHFYDNLVTDLKSGKTIEMFSDSYRSSLHFSTASELLIKLFEISDDLPPAINVSGDKDLSKYDIGLMLADKLGVDRERVVPVRVSDSPGIFKSPRASSTLMDNSLVKNLLDVKEIAFRL